MNLVFSIPRDVDGGDGLTLVPRMDSHEWRLCHLRLAVVRNISGTN
jgi:hypothetical protein